MKNLKIEVKEYAKRVGKLQRAIARRKLGAMMIFNGNNRYYYTGLRSSLGYLLVTPNEAILMVDSRYFEAAKEAAPHCDIRLFKNFPKDLKKWWADLKTNETGFEEATPWNVLKVWREAMTGAEFKPSGDLISSQRVVKSAAEIKILAQAAAYNDECWERVIRSVEPGVTELDLRNRLRAIADEISGEGESFDCIIGFGEMSARPHYHPGPRPIEPGELLLIDQGVSCEGYCSDMTRTVAVGGRRIKKKLMTMYEAVLEANEEAIKAIAPGVPCKEIDAAARKALKKYGMVKRFTHGLGHGVGLDIHETPFLGSRNEEPLKAGMVITIEPGVYYPGLGGVRIEDLVVVTRNGYKVLSHSPKEWRVI